MKKKKWNPKVIQSSDILRLPYTSDLTEGGIAYALRSLSYSFHHAGSSLYDKLRRVVASAAVELAFRRYLSQENIPYEVRGSNPFTDPERYDVTLGGRRCSIKSFFISHRDQISEIRRDQQILLKAPALVPSDQYAGEGHTENDLYVFAFLGGLIAASQNDLKKAIESNQPHYLAHIMPEKWRKPLNWNPLGALTLKSESEEQMLLEVGGQDEGREFTTRTFNLPPKTRAVFESPFYSISALHVHHLPTARVGIHSELHKDIHVIGHMDWRNLWVYGMDIYFAGYITCGEFRQRARMLPPNSRVFQYNRTHVKNLSVPVSELRPLSELFEKVRSWDANKVL